jgi:hypothetical protein
MWRVETYIRELIFVLSDWNFLLKKLKIKINWSNVFNILQHYDFFQIIFYFILNWDCLYLNHIQDGFTLCLMPNVHHSLLPPLSFCDWLTLSSKFSHWSFPSLSFNYWFHFGGLRGFLGRKLSNLWKKLNFKIKLNDF